MSEEIEIIEEVTIIEVEETPINGENIDATNHAELNNLDLEDQHPIKSIIGLKTKLDEIQAPKDTQCSKGRGYAEYRRWKKTPGTNDDWVGRFVALVPGEDTIELVNENNYNIFGVTVPVNYSAFVGSEEWEVIKNEDDIVGYQSTRDRAYGLVCFDGAVEVCYPYDGTNPIKVGDYVKPNNEGLAVKNEKADGYYRVLGVGDDLGRHYVVINLSLSATDTDNISFKHAKTADDYTENGKIKGKFDEVDLEIDKIKHGITVVGDARHSAKTDLADRATNADRAEIADNFIDGVDKEGNDIIRGIKEKFDGVLNGETPALILNAGVVKDDLNFIVNGSWSPDPCGNYRSETTITINNVVIDGWQLKGIWIKNDKYIQILISEDKVFTRSLDKIDEVRTHGDWVQIAGEGTSVTHAESANKLGGIEAKSFRGNGTGFTYKLLVLGKNDNLMGYKTEAHYFVQGANNAENFPNLYDEENSCKYGFLDVEYFDGNGFSPDDAIGNEPISIQTFRDYQTHEVWTRNFNHNMTVNPEQMWSNWFKVGGEYTRVWYAENSNNCQKAQSAINDALGNGIVATYARKDEVEETYVKKDDIGKAYGGIFGFSVDSSKKKVEFPIGNIITLKDDKVSIGSSLLGSDLSGDSLYLAYNTSNNSVVEGYQYITTKSTGNDTNFSLIGTWRLIGKCGYIDSDSIYLIQRVL